MAKISVIANFYNSGKYIPKLLKSIANQSFIDWQLICIDDCSPNRDNLIIERWIKKLGIESKIILIRNKENLGISRAKEVGINYVRNNCKGCDYTTFIDGDDWFEPKAFENLYNTAIRFSTDLVVSNHYRVFKLGPLEKKVLWRANLQAKEYRLIFTREDAIQRFLYNLLLVFHLGNTIFPIPYWAKLYKNDFLSRLKFDFPSKENTTSEDNSFSTEVLLQCNNLVFIDIPTYNWRWGGITSGNRTDSNWSQIKLLKYIVDTYPYSKYLVEKFGFINGKNDLLVGIKNVTWWSFRVGATEKPTSKKSDSLKHVIKELINKPAYDDLRNHKFNISDSDKSQLDFLESLNKKDVGEIYCLSYLNHKDTKSHWNPQIFFRNILNLFH